MEKYAPRYYNELLLIALFIISAFAQVFRQINLIDLLTFSRY